MCGRLKINQTIVLPGMRIPTINPNDLPMYWGQPREVQHSLPPFARQETLEQKWLSKTDLGWKIKILPVDDFAELDSQHEERWAGAPAKIKVLIRNAGPYWSVVIITRASTKEELARYDHDRMPVTVEDAA